MTDPTFVPKVTEFNLEHADLKGHAYIDPRKLILTKENLEAFQASKTHETIVSYIITLNECVVGVKLTDDLSLSPVRGSALGNSTILSSNSFASLAQRWHRIRVYKPF